MARSTSFFQSTPVSDYRLRRHVLSFTSPIETETPANNLVWVAEVGGAELVAILAVAKGDELARSAEGRTVVRCPDVSVEPERTPMRERIAVIADAGSSRGPLRDDFPFFRGYGLY